MKNASIHADEHGDARPGEEEIENAEAVATKVELMDAEASQDNGEEDADDFVFAGSLVFCVEPSALVFSHADGVDGIDWIHNSFLMNQ